MRYALQRLNGSDATAHDNIGRVKVCREQIHKLHHHRPVHRLDTRYYDI